MQALQIFEYESSSIEFEIINGQVFANATSMATVFKKKPNDIFKTKMWIEYEEEVCIQLNYRIEDIRFGKKGGNDKDNQGSWIHEELIIEFARRLNVKFSIWCNKKIAELLKTGKTEIRKQNPLELAKSTILLLTEELESTKARGDYEFEARHNEERQRKKAEKEIIELKSELTSTKTDLHKLEDQEDLRNLYRR
ncbi:KilA-N domain-containing protein [Chondrinema litorale]|uniref:KilA-N domain-containing protein n=1 Tax=Chondrinema litorale TaxID=2994555 RepID=UPI002543B46B|nr:KilA-N domain-containing protein [Chondrinema litorale]UZS00290.1 KilA-N domain-containing protein [Chondrinema litorale]